MSKKEEKVLMYDGDKRYTFIHVTIWECIKYWLITKLTGTDIKK